MADLLSIKATFELNTAKFRQGMAQATAHARSASERIGRLLGATAKQVQRAFSNMARGIGRSFNSLGGLLASAGIITGFQAIARSIDETAKAAKQLDISIGALQALQDAAKKSGVDSNAATQAFREFTIKSGEAARGTGPLAEVLATLGIDAKAFADLPLEQRLGVFADALQQVSSRAEQAAIANQAFGGEGVKLLPLLDEGSAGLRRLGEQFAKTGAIISDDGAAAVETYNDTMQDLQSSLGALTQELVIELAPALTEIADLISEFVGPINRVRKMLVDVLANAFLTTTITIRRLWNDLVASFLEGLAKISEQSATARGALFGAQAGADALNQATALERSASAFRSRAAQAQAELDVLRSQSDSAITTRSTTSGTAQANPLQQVGTVQVPSTQRRQAQGFDFSGIRDMAQKIVASSTQFITGISGAVASRLQQQASITGVVQGVDTMFGQFRTGEQINLLRSIVEATERTADAVSRTNGGALT